MVKRLTKLKPAFWDHMGPDTPATGSGINFRRKWKMIVTIITFLSLLPLIAMTLVDFNLTKTVIEDEVKASMLKGLNSIAAAASVSTIADTIVRLEDFIAFMDTDETSDLFIINTQGKMITASIHYGESGGQSGLVPADLEGDSGIGTATAPGGLDVLMGWVRIPGTPLIVVQVRPKQWLTDLWLKPRIKLMGYLGISITLIFLSILGMATFLVGRIHTADRKRMEALHHEEHANRLASIGRLASGVAHEINNPLDIINQKTGLMIDLLSLDKGAPQDDRLLPLANKVIEAVKRCGTITRQLLDFARHMEPGIEPVDILEVANQVVSLLQREADHRNISISIDTRGQIPRLACDRGGLQQIFLNLAENALAAMDRDGTIDILIIARKANLEIRVSDTGKGIEAENLNKIFEPFYSSRNEGWGAGLGLAITYGLVKEMGGDIKVKSKVNKGTRFVLSLPLNPQQARAPQQERESQQENPAMENTVPAQARPLAAGGKGGCNNE